jgi:hypothetical protein
MSPQVLSKEVEAVFDMRDAGFSGESCKPRSSRKRSTSGLTSFSSSSFELPVMMKSSAYRTKFTFRIVHLPIDLLYAGRSA